MRSVTSNNVQVVKYFYPIETHKQTGQILLIAKFSKRKEFKNLPSEQQGLFNK